MSVDVFLLVQHILDVPIRVLARHQKEKESKSSGSSNDSTGDSTTDDSSNGFSLLIALGRVGCATTASSASIEREGSEGIPRAVEAKQRRIRKRTHTTDVIDKSRAEFSIAAGASRIITATDTADIVLWRVAIEFSG